MGLMVEKWEAYRMDGWGSPGGVIEMEMVFRSFFFITSREKKKQKASDVGIT